MILYRRYRHHTSAIAPSMSIDTETLNLALSERGRVFNHYEASSFDDLLREAHEWDLEGRSQGYSPTPKAENSYLADLMEMWAIEHGLDHNPCSEVSA